MILVLFFFILDLCFWEERVHWSHVGFVPWMFVKDVIREVYYSAGHSLSLSRTKFLLPLKVLRNLIPFSRDPNAFLVDLKLNRSPEETLFPGNLSCSLFIHSSATVLCPTRDLEQETVLNVCADETSGNTNFQVCRISLVDIQVEQSCPHLLQDWDGNPWLRVSGKNYSGYSDGARHSS